MHLYVWAGSSIPLEPLVAEAVDRLGYVRPDRKEWLTERLAGGGAQASGRWIREQGQRMTPDERAALGMDRWEGGHISYEVWDALTERGRSNPQRSFDATCSRAIRNGWLMAECARDNLFLKEGDFFVMASFKPAQPTCAAGSRLIGQIVTALPTFPLPDCDIEICECRWELLTERGARRVGLL